MVSEFGARLKVERERLAFTQAAFASECGMGKRTYIRLEHGERTPDLTVLLAAAAAGADLAFLMTGSRDAGRQLFWAEQFDEFAKAPLVMACLGDIDIDGLLDDLKGVSVAGGDDANDKAALALISRCPRLAKAVRQRVAGEGGLLERIGAELATVVAEEGGVLPVAQTVRAMLFLHKLFSGVGEIDRAAVVETVRLARG